MNDMVKIFEDMGGEHYDKNNASFHAVLEMVQTLNSLILKDLPENARILSVGIGTGADIIELAKNNPKRSFVGIEPAKAMLDECERKLEKAGVLERCTLFHGYLEEYEKKHEEEYESTDEFDAILCLFVMHFLKDLSKRSQMMASFAKKLKKKGTLIQTEISVDTASKEYDSLIKNWMATHALTGADEEKLKKIPEMIENTLGVISPKETERLLKENGFSLPIQYMQAFLIRGWYARKA